MLQLKKVLRILALVMLIAMATIGVGLSGGIPVPPNRKKENTIEVRVELKEKDENKNDIILFVSRE